MKDIKFPIRLETGFLRFMDRAPNCEKILHDKNSTVEYTYLIINENKTAELNVPFIQIWGYGETAGTESDTFQLTDEEFNNLIEEYKQVVVYDTFQKRENDRKKEQLKAIYKELFG